MNCPECQYEFKDVFTKEEDGATLDCPKCNALLIYKDGEIQNFHEWMHNRDKRWPADGKGTGYIEV